MKHSTNGINCMFGFVGLYKLEIPSSTCQSYGCTETESKHLCCPPNFCDCFRCSSVSLHYSDLRICNQPFVTFWCVPGITGFGLRVIFLSVYGSPKLLLIGLTVEIGKPYHKWDALPDPSMLWTCASLPKMGFLITYLLTPWCRVLPEQLTGLQLVKKFPPFHGTRMFITALTSVRPLSLSWVSPIQSIYPHPTSWRSILILSTHLLLGLPSGLFPSGFPTNNLHAPLSSPICATCPAHLIPKCPYIHTKLHRTMVRKVHHRTGHEGPERE